MSGLVLLLGYIFAADIEINTKLIYEAAPEDLALTLTTGMGLDKDHNLYVLDGDNRTILVWDEQGKYAGSVGRQGEGPGEISMATKVGNLAITNNEIWVFDESRRQVSVWGLDREFRRNLNYPTHIQRIHDIAPFEDKLLITNGSTETGKQELVLLDRNLKVLEVIDSIKWEMFTRREDQSYLLKPFAARIEMGVFGDYVFLARTRDNLITRSNLKTGKKNTARVSLNPDDLSEEDKAFHIERFKMWARPHDDIQFPQKYDTIFGVLPFDQNKVMLLTRYDDSGGRIWGAVYQFDQKRVVGTFDQVISASLPRLSILRDKIFAIMENEDGELAPALLEIKLIERGRP